MGLLENVFLGDGTEVQLIEFGADQTVQVGYFNMIGEYRRLWINRSNVFTYDPTAPTYHPIV